MSMIGKLRQMSEFDLAKYKKNPGEMVRALAGAQHRATPPGSRRCAKRCSNRPS
jgi:hypothetical protein